jgi:hypothetical protein
VPLDRPFAAIARELAAEAPAHALCDGFEDEAWAAAAQVLDHLGRGERPVALVALDRVLVRRVRALLERAGVRIADETGWKMSTTRAGASVMSLLQAARPGRQRRRVPRLAQVLAADGDARGGLARRARSDLSAAARLAPRRDRVRRAPGRRGAPSRGSDRPRSTRSRGPRDASCRRGSMPFTTRSSAGACSRSCATTTPAARRSPRSASTRRSRPRVAHRSATASSR